MQTIPDAVELLKELHSFGREFAGVSLGLTDPWGPLHRVVPGAWCAGFMFMGVIQQAALRIHEYKHGITRRCLCLDAGGRAYAYDALTGKYGGVSDMRLAVERVFEGIEIFGAGLTPALAKSLAEYHLTELEKRGDAVVAMAPEGMVGASPNDAL